MKSLGKWNGLLQARVVILARREIVEPCVKVAERYGCFEGVDCW